MDNLKPVDFESGRVVITPEKNKIGDIEFSEQIDKDKPMIGVVVAVSENLKGSIEAGEKIVYRKYSPETFKLGDEEVYFIDASDILAIKQQ